MELLNLRPVQCCISTVSFPRTIEHFEEMLNKQLDNNGTAATDMDAIFHPDWSKELSWSAPKWLTTGDVFFLYHASTASKWTRRVRSQVRRLSTTAPSFGPFLDAAERAVCHSDQYGGTLFASALVKEPSYSSGADDMERTPHDWHFKGKIFAPLESVHLFSAPVRLDEIDRVVKISRGGTITPVAGPHYEELKALLSRQNALPDYISDSCGSMTGFRSLNRHNWPEISCRAGASFLYEGQLRLYLIDYLLDELKDQGTPGAFPFSCSPLFRN